MTTVDRLWYLAEEADQCSEQVYHRLCSTHDGFVEFESKRTVSRDRFRTVTDRITTCEVPFGAHTLAYRPSGEVLLVRHDGVDMWVVPGGEVDSGETLREGARRELREEAGIEASYEGMGVLGRIDFRSGGHQTWGVLPVYEARAETTSVEVCDPDGEISDAQWFSELPDDTRDRRHIAAWRDRKFG